MSEPELATRPCPHCGVVGHWPTYEAEQLAAMRCPWSGLLLENDDGIAYCGVCDCFGYPMHPGL